MNKGIHFDTDQYLRTTLHRIMTYEILVYFFYVRQYLPWREKKPKSYGPVQEKEYN